MSLGKELLLSCIVIMHISFLATKPIEPIKLRVNIREIELSLCNLKLAEEDYVEYMFEGKSLTKNQLKVPEGITWPVGNSTEEIMTSICSITDYLENMPKLISNLTQMHLEERIINNITAFNSQLKSAVSQGSADKKDGVLKPCHRNVTATHDFMKLQLGFEIIYFARKWVEHFAGTYCNL